ncbi:M13 family metallopeptidase [Sphingomonas arantia]|uniref:M13 family metallopeptidase n=1 Tax=Sphingomonas arantia TaxID=1460676 RepID=A0ABW4TYS7_9SPHN
MRLKIALLGASAFASIATTGFAQTANAPAPRPVAAVNGGKPELGTFGFDTAGMDRSVAPGDNFDAFASGTWKKTNPIPADRSSFGMFTKLDDLSTERSRAILEEAARTPGTRIGDLYASFVDQAAVDAKGAAPLKPTLDAIDAAKTKPALAAEMGKLARFGVPSPFRLGVGQDDRNPETYIVSMAQGGLGLPDRDYYLKTDPKLVEARTAYAGYLTKLFALAGLPNGAARAQAVIAFETKLAQVQWTRIDSRDAVKTYNKWSAADFAQKAPGFDWTAYLAATGVNGQTQFLVAQPTAFTGSAAVIAATPLNVLQDYMKLRAINRFAPFLSQPFVDASFAFNSTQLQGTPQNRDRWKRGVALVNGQVGEDLGKIYVAKYFPPEAKAQADLLVKNVIAAMGDRIDALTWMAPETKVKARAKLAAFRAKIGYPDTWRDYSALKIDRSDLLGNVQRATAFEFQRDLNKLGKPLDREEWGMTPTTINAYANFGMNEIVFPAAILQPPFFDPNADPAVNYGGIGAVIGHEISHHFDDQGSQYDSTGKLTEWWTPKDVAQFKALTGQLVAQYDKYEPIPGLHVQGGLTLGENIGDLAGLTAAYGAYQKSLGGKPAPVIDGMTGDQRFYLGWAQVWRRNDREAALRQQLLTDPHSPAEQRANVVRNLDPWYAAYKPKPGEKLYLTPAERVRIW